MEDAAVRTRVCPSYMNAACFTAATWHTDADGNEAVEDYKGCSAFKLDLEDQYCGVTDVNGESYNTCKSTCDSDNCNVETPQKKNQCYVCQVTVDSVEEIVGVGHQSCWNDPQAYDLETCPEGFDYCSEELEADWDQFGGQTYRMKRACAKTPEPTSECIDGSDAANHFLFKDCTQHCDGDACNDGFDNLAVLFASENAQESCLVCSYTEDENGDVSGDSRCLNNADEIKDASQDCPIYANAGCYTGSSAWYDPKGMIHEQVWKGCSTFEYEEVNCHTIRKVFEKFLIFLHF